MSSEQITVYNYKPLGRAPRPHTLVSVICGNLRPSGMEQCKCDSAQCVLLCMAKNKIVLAITQRLMRLITSLWGVCFGGRWCSTRHMLLDSSNHTAFFLHTHQQ